MKAVPALLNKTTDEMRSQYEMLRNHFTGFQIDICDGILVPNTTINVQQITKEIESWPAQNVHGKIFDFDLMVADFLPVLDALNKLTKTVTISSVFLHTKALKNTQLPSSNTYTIGIAIDPDDRIQDLNNQINLKSLNAIQIMTVNPGFQGSPFLENQLVKIEQLRKLGYGAPIYMDGGINDRTIPYMQNLYYKPDVLGMGSFLTKAPKIEERVTYLHQQSIQTS